MLSRLLFTTASWCCVRQSPKTWSLFRSPPAISCRRVCDEEPDSFLTGGNYFR